MTEIIGDIVAPSELLVPGREDSSLDGISGQMFISGTNLHFVDWTGTTRLVTST